MHKQDLTEYGSSELSDNVMNDESLYLSRNSANLCELLEEYFIFTTEQWDELVQDLEDEKEEMEK